MAHRVGIVGAGRIGRLHAANIGTRAGRLCAGGVADPDAGSAAVLGAELDCRAHEDWRELVARDDVHAVLLCSPSGEHADQIAACAEAGKHVFCEKPIADELAGADRAVEAAENAGIVLQIGYNRRFDRSFAAVREAVTGGRVGAPVLVRVTSRDPEPAPRDVMERIPGLFVDTTSHDLDMVRFVTGSEIVEVTARAGSLVSDDARELGLVDTALTTAVTETGTLAAIDNCWRSAYGYDQRLEVHGTEGTALAGNDLRDTTLVADRAGFHAPPLPHFFLDRYAETYVLELEAFADALDGAPVPVGGRDGRAALAAALAAHHSSMEGRVVRLDELA
jgi:myo-inositol 2-dehydrogenase / D-chiro-inositol 1-dehydrogenase